MQANLNLVLNEIRRGNWDVLPEYGKGENIVEGGTSRSDKIRGPEGEHAHRHVEAVALTEGVAEISTGGRRFPLTKGKVYVILQNTLHSECWTDAGEGYRLLWMAIGGNGTMFFESTWTPGNGHTSWGHYHQLYNAPEHARAIIFEPEMDVRDPVVSARIQSLLLEQCSGALKRFRDETPLHRSSSSYLADFVEGYLREHYAEEVTANQIAEILRCSVSYINRVFRWEKGTSLYQYLIKLRIQHAQQLLQSGQMLVQEVAFSIGYSDPLYFSRLFRKHVGVSPSEYAKSVERTT